MNFAQMINNIQDRGGIIKNDELLRILNEGEVVAVTTVNPQIPDCELQVEVKEQDVKTVLFIETGSWKFGLSDGEFAFFKLADIQSDAT